MNEKYLSNFINRHYFRNVIFPGTRRSASAASSNTIKARVILKINQYYILYTSPDVPYIDKQNRFMIPLRAISELLGANVGYDASTKKGDGLMGRKKRGSDDQFQERVVQRNVDANRHDTRTEKRPSFYPCEGGSGWTRDKRNLEKFTSYDYRCKIQNKQKLFPIWRQVESIFTIRRKV